MPCLVIAVLEGWANIRQQDGEPRLPFSEWHPGDVFAIQIQEIEQKEREPGGITRIRRPTGSC